MPEMAYLCWKIVMIRYRINDEKKLKIKNMKKALIKLRNKEVLSYHDNCTINSYKGWLNFCNSYRLKEKYFIPLKDKKYINKDGKLRRVNIW